MANKNFGGFRHGDVQILPLDREPSLTDMVKVDTNKVALGEVTGHSHQFKPIDPMMFDTSMVDVYAPTSKSKQDQDLRYVFLKQPMKIDHEEHFEIKFPAGWYQTTVKRQYKPGGWAKVVD